MDATDERILGHFGAALSSHLQTRQPGHCVVVKGLVSEYAREIARLAYRPDDRDRRVRLVNEEPKEPFEITPFAAVRMRDGATLGRYVLCLIAPERSAVEDSLGANTFEVLDTAPPNSLYRSAALSLANDLDASLREITDGVFAALAAHRAAPDAWSGLRYLARIAISDDASGELGRALTELDLLPDSRIRRDMDESGTARYISQNLAILEILTRMVPSSERVRELAPLVPKSWMKPLQAALSESRETRDASALVQTVVRLGLAQRFDVAEVSEAPTPGIEDLRVLRFTGDIKHEASGWVVTPKASQRLGVRVRCNPAPKRLVGLKEIVIEIFEDSTDGAVPTGHSTTIRSRFPANTDFERTIRVDRTEIDEGHYRFQITAFDSDNVVIESAISKETFTVGDEPTPPERIRVPSVAAARALARSLGGGIQEMAADIDTSDASSAIVIQYQGVDSAFMVDYPALLRKLERVTIAEPDGLGRYSIEVGQNEIVAKNAPQIELVTQRLVDARASLMQAVTSRQLIGSESPSLLACDMQAILPSASEYINAWIEAVDNAPSQLALRVLLGTDHVKIGGLEDERACLIGPFHPIKLSWLLAYDRFLQGVGHSLPNEGLGKAQRWLARVTPDNVPLVAAEQGDGWFRFTESLTQGWGLYISSDSTDAERTSTIIRKWLSLDRSDLMRVKSADLEARITRYLAIHPYIEQLILDVVRPGDGRVVVDALKTLGETHGHLRFVVRMFDDVDPHLFGEGFDEFMRDENTDRFHTASGSILYPALTYSKHPLDHLIDRPEDYPAHLCVFLDHFRAVVKAAPPSNRRSIFMDGLMIRPASVFETGNGALDPGWDETVTGDESRVGRCFDAINRALVKTIPNAVDGAVPALRLRLDERDRRLLAAVHRKSDWVVIVDPIFSDAYLDRPDDIEAEILYLLDHANDPDRTSSRRITVSTRSRGYLSRVLRPLGDRTGIALDDLGSERLLRGLNVLGAGLVLRLLDRSTKAVEALTLGLAALQLGAAGILRHTLVVPLDLYPGLFTHGDSGRRADLLLIRPQPKQRLLDLAIVEVKARSKTGGSVPGALVDDFVDQLNTTWRSLETSLFGNAASPLERAAQVDRLRTMLRIHLDRAARFALLSVGDASAMSSLIDDLEDGYKVSLPALHALVFDLTGEGSETLKIDGDLPITVWHIGSSDVNSLLATSTKDVTTVQLGLSAGIDIDAVFGSQRPTNEWDGISVSAEPQPEKEKSTPSSDETASEGERDDAGSNSRERAVVDAQEGVAELPGDYVGPNRDTIAFIGSSTTRQFGIVGHLVRSSRPVALDTDGTSVISVFGAQGSGKSYTIGSLIEAALIRESHLGALHSPLSGVVFHYSRDPAYEPEFVSMAVPNSNPADVARLKELGAKPSAILGVTVLSPPKTVARRRDELPGCIVEPLQIGTGQLTLDHWRLLMGLEGGTQLYGRELGRILEDLRATVTFDTLADAIRASALSPAQKDLANLRLGFVKSFVSDGADIEQHLEPGRLLIIDLRDEYVDQDQALSLFMVGLDLLTGGSRSKPKGNKVVVFDEAHKYIRSGALVERLVTKIREMRHLGTTVVIASQDPPSLPQEVIELSTALVAHRFTSPQWLSHLKRFNAGFADHAPEISAFARLDPGRAYVYATIGDEVFERPQLVRFRPRLTRHGGETRRATDE